MKKIISFFSVLLIAITMTGCSSKGEEVKCTMDEDNEKGTMVATIKNDKVTKISVDSSQTYEDEDELNMAYTFSKMAISMVDEIDGMSASIKKNGKSLEITMTMDLTKMSSEDIEDELGLESFDKDGFIKYAEEEGYTCK